jgi:hypothetical protein
MEFHNKGRTSSSHASLFGLSVPLVMSINGGKHISDENRWWSTLNTYPLFWALVEPINILFIFLECKISPKWKNQNKKNIFVTVFLFSEFFGPNFENKNKNPPHFDSDFSLLTNFKLGFLAMYTSSKDLLPFNAKSLFGCQRMMQNQNLKHK